MSVVTTDFKVIGIGDPGSSVMFGGDDLDKVNKILNGTDLLLNINFNNEVHFKSNKFVMWDFSNSFKIYWTTLTETANRTIGIPVLGGNRTLAFIDMPSQVFTTAQKVQAASEAVRIYNPTNVLNSFVEYGYSLNNGATPTPTEVFLGGTRMNLIANTAGAETGEWSLETKAAGVLATRLYSYVGGNGGLILGNHQFLALDESGLTAARTFTFPNTSVQLTGLSDTATLSNKTMSVDLNTFKHSTTNATGDLWKGNGTQMVRYAIGSNGSRLKAVGGDAIWTTERFPYDYLVYYSGTQYEALNGNTGVIDFTNTLDGAAVINSCINALTSGGRIVYSGTILTRSTTVLKTKISLLKASMSSVIKQDASQNLAAVMESFNYTTLVTTPTTGGEYDVELDVIIDGNKANNITTATIGLRKFGYNWKINQLHILNCKGDGYNSEWSDSPVCPNTGSCMDDFIHNLRINGCDGNGWVNKGPHDSYADTVMIHNIGGTGYIQQYLLNNYDGSLQCNNMHIFSCVGKGADIQGGTFRYNNFQSESITGTGGIGLHQNGGTIEGGYGTFYLSDIGVKLETGGNSHLSNTVSRNNKVTGVVILKNNVQLDAFFIYDNNNAGSGKGLILGDGTHQLANVKLNGMVYGSPTALVDWGNSTNQGIVGNIMLYTDSTNTIAILNESTINTDTNSFEYENLANGTAIKTNKGKPLLYKTGRTDPRNYKDGVLYCGQNTMVTTGLFNGVVETGTTSFVQDQWEGIIRNYNTGITINSPAGLNGGAATPTIFTRTSNPFKYSHIQVPVVTNSRFYGGFASYGQVPNTDTPLGATDSGILVGWRSTGDTTIQIFNNDGTAAAPTPINTALAIPTTFFEYEIQADDTNAKFIVRVKTSAGEYTTTVTTRIPASTTRLANYDIVQNSTTTAMNLKIDVSVLRSKFIF